jgi:hypothetical protein
MSPKYENLHAENLNLDKLIPLTFFSKKQMANPKIKQGEKCNHLGYLIKDSIRNINGLTKQRLKCSKCDQRFGSDVNALDLLHYQNKINYVVYELFLEGSKQKYMEKRWGIPQDQLSKFKRKYVGNIFVQNPNLVFEDLKELPKGLIYGDETYMGKKGNSNTEIVFVNESFEILATSAMENMSLGSTIINTFSKITQKNRERMRVLVSDGEPTYCTLGLNSNRTVIHVQQYHSHALLGQITLNKYEDFGPHILHFQIHTHWKIFKNNKREFGFHWNINFIKGKLYSGSGRPTKQLQKSKKYQLWQLKKNEYEADTFSKSGTARVFINLETKKISLREGSKQWMKNIFQRLLPIFSGKCITNNRVESKHSQIKRKGNIKKQQDPSYVDQLFLIHEYIVQHGHLPAINLEGRPLYKYLIKNNKTKPRKYVFWEQNKKSAQTMISHFL